MPGLAGYITQKGFDKALLQRMANAIKHEDFQRVDMYSNERFGFARVHLGVFNSDSQPLFNDDKSICIFVDGKIFGYKKEKEILEKEGYSFPLNNDLDFCLNSYLEYGVDSLCKLDGSFVIILCDLNRNELTIVNDRYGLRPLYYKEKNKTLYISSEVKAIEKNIGEGSNLDDRSISDFFSFGQILGNRTYFDDISVLPGGSVLTWNGRLNIHNYWKFTFDEDYSQSEDEIVEELVYLFRNAVEKRIEDNHKYGVSLSGGLDSRVVIAATKSKEVEAITFGQSDCDEVIIAKEVSQIVGSKITVIEITPEMIIENAEKCLHLADGMNYAGMGYSPHVNQVARTHIDVIMGGLAFDIILGGSRLDRRVMNKRGFGGLSRLLEKRLSLFTSLELKDLLRKEFCEKTKNHSLFNIDEELADTEKSTIGNRVDCFMLNNRIRRHVLMGQVLKRNYLEDTVPTYDNALIELVQKIPTELRYRHRIYRKFLMRLSPRLAKVPYDKTMINPEAPLLLWDVSSKLLSMQDKLIKKIQSNLENKMVLQNKRSYVHFGQWFEENDRWSKYYEGILLNSQALINEYVNRSRVKKLFEEARRGNASSSNKTLFLASFEIFLNQVKNGYKEKQR